MGNIYYGIGFNRVLVGQYENGIIYQGDCWNRSQIGAYDHRYIYQASSSWSGTIIGEYENGIIYQGSGWDRVQIGSYEQGISYFSTSCWDRTAAGEYDDSPVGAAALLLFSELQQSTASSNVCSNSEENMTGRDSPGSSNISFSIIPQILVGVGGIILSLFLVYHMYFTTSWKWANYAMFFTSVFCCVITNIILYQSYKKSEDISKFCSDLINTGMSTFVLIGIVIAFVIYIIEQLVIGQLTLGSFFLGFIAAPVNYAIYAAPFAIAELIALLIVKHVLKRRNR